MLTKDKTHVRIPRKQWEELRRNPTFADVIELLEDQADLEEANKIEGKDMSLPQYLKKRGIRNRP